MMGHRKDIDELIKVTQKSDMSVKFSTTPGVLQEIYISGIPCLPFSVWI